MATVWERAAHSVNHVFLCNVSVCNFGRFESGTLVLIATVPGHWFPFTLSIHSFGKHFH